MHREERRRLLARTLQRQPSLTDRELAQALRVSTQTIRLDRMVLGIPDMRARLMAHPRGSVSGAPPLPQEAGELVAYERGRSASSRQMVTGAMTDGVSQHVQGHVLFAQAESLALATVGSEAAHTGTCRVRFRRPVAVGERLLARATVLRTSPGRWVVLVTVSAGDEVFRGKFEVHAALKEAVR